MRSVKADLGQVAKLFKEVTEITLTAGKVVLEDIVDEVKRRQSLFSESNETIEETVKRALNYQEQFRGEYTLEDAIRWFKSNIKPEMNGGCLLRTPKSNGGYKVYHCFIDKAQNPLLGGRYPYYVVDTLVLSDDLSAQFGDKDMIVLK